ncbi:Phycobilisome protein [Gloeothece citriformis PCC 7424]|uniref:Phycobilisome protein n=1 Tax=Gloeothece citriformis (strain PCC 7424) TaxID=65393 RepID=B7K915_GLOC7|nr:phycobilisome protein [Gloeothece citriformis]ACK72784.1 Phycobilisome protein [Gloeothece citriformis PCC 7424]
MLTKLTTLAQQADGRYADSNQLQFLHDYFSVASVRLSAYEKIRAAHEEIIQQVRQSVNKTHPNLFLQNSKDLWGVCHRDMSYILRYVSTVVLIDDLEQLKTFLVWHSKIMKAFRDQYPSQIAYSLMEKIVTQLLTPEESTLVKPAFQLVGGFLQ